MVDIDRLKLLESIVFFLENTQRCGAVKLFKLLYFLDMLHFRETGRPVTGLQYRALPYGPVPTSLYDEFRNPQADFAATISITAPPSSDALESEPSFTKIAPKNKWRDRYLTVREKRIASELAEIFKEASASDMSNVSHATNGPWDKAKNRNPGRWTETIDYLDALSPTLKMGSGKAINRALLSERSREFSEAKEIFK
ncbi:MAG: SocA family protein [Rhodocyclales bacterium]|nr:SocA family protein [Rhodocyclales bacterium]